MKITQIVLFSVFLFACMDKQPEVTLDVMGESLTETDKQIIKQVKDFNELVHPISRSGEGLGTALDVALRDVDSYTLYSCPFYEIDCDKFYEDPSPQQIIASLFLPKHEKWFTAKQNDKTFFLAVTKGENGWRTNHYFEDWDSMLSWLPSKLKEAEASDYKLIKYGSNKFLTFNKGNEPVFYHITGDQEMSGNFFCEYLLNDLNQWSQSGKSRNSDVRQKMKKQEFIEILEKMFENTEPKSK